MITFFRDLRYGVRMLLKTPAVTFVVILALALGIGANTAIFSVINAVLLRPLPYNQPDQLLFLNERDEMSISYPNFVDWRNQNHVFEKIGVYNRNSYNLTGYGEAERILAAQVSADLFAALRVNAAIGRVFTNDEDKAGANPVVVLSHALWQRRFGGQTSILNQSLNLNGRSYTILGVMPENYQFPSRVEMWVPVGPLAVAPGWQQRNNHPGLFGVARLKPGITIEQAQADMNIIASNLARQYPDTNADNGVRIRTMTKVLVGDTVRDTLWILFGAVAFVLLIACANIANLLLARATARRKEMAIRSALGAGRWRIARQLLTESVLLSLIGGGLALVIAQWSVRLILYMSPTAIPRSREITLDWRVLGFTIGVSLLTGILFGLVPALQAGEVDVNEILKETGRGSSTRHWLRSSLVVVEVATTMVLLIGAGLLIRSFYRLQNVDPGFSSEHLTSFTISLPSKKYANVDQRAAFFNQLLQNLRTLPGVQSVAAASGLPLGNNDWVTGFTLDGQPPPKPGDNAFISADGCSITPDYFRAMGIPLLQGRYFTDQDNRSFLAGRNLSKMDEGEQMRNGLNVLIIDQEFAKRYWPGENAVGKRVRFGFDTNSPVLTIVGVVGRVKLRGLDADSNLVQGYLSFSQMPRGEMTVIMKGAGDPNQLIPAARAQVRMLDPDQPIYDMRTMNEIRGESVAPQLLNLTLMSIFAGIAFVLAIVGIYGVMSYAVTQRTHEIGIRIAIGAQPRDVIKMILGQGMLLTVIGLGIGLLGAFGLTRLLASMLFSVKPTDPLTFAGVALLLTSVALIACYIPCRRATSIDPVRSLRYE